MTEFLEAAYGAVASDLAQARALPGPAYADPAVFAAEQARVFATSWIAVARASELAEPGVYRVVDVAGAPVVVVRDESGAIRVLSNVCRHRGMPVMEGAGTAKSLTCPYHLWRYGLDGRLASATAMAESQVFDRAACALPEIASCLWEGWVFANLDGKAPPLAPQLARLTQRLEGLNVAGMVTATVVEFDSPWNWKVMVENFMESYHHIGPHAGTLQRSNPALGTYDGDGDHLYSVLENPPADSENASLLVGAIFPFTLIAFSETGTPSGVWYEMDRISHANFRLRVHFLAPPEVAADPSRAGAFRDAFVAIHLEDIPACEGVQRGVTSPLYAPGPLSHLEASLLRFHRFLKARMAP